MKTLITILIFIAAICPRASAQPKVYDLAPPKHYKDNHACVYRHKYSNQQRMKMYPFSLGGVVELVSFRYHKNNYPVAADTLVADSLVETHILTAAQTDSLTDILYNNFYIHRPHYGSMNQCWFPRNAVLFFDSAGKLKAYILLCFHCLEYRKSSDEVGFGDKCHGEMEKLRQFFAATGIKLGTAPSINLYPGETPDDYVGQ